MTAVAPTDYARLKQLWSAGLTATECGNELGLTGSPSDIREAVLFAVEQASQPPGTKPRQERMLSRQPKSVVKKPDVDTKPAWKPKAKPAANDDDLGLESDGFDLSTPQNDLEIPVTQRKTILQLTNKTCRWPVGEPRDPNFFYCGGDAVEDQPYCASHCRRAFVGFGDRQRRRA